MAQITKIKLRLKTAGRSGAGTDSLVYLGIGGREFRIESKGVDDFEPATERTYVLRKPPAAGPPDAGLGEDERPVRYPAHNDPSADYPLDSDTLDQFPLYLRYHPRIVAGMEDPDTWILGEVEISIVIAGAGGAEQVVRTFAALPENQSLWLGVNYGTYFYFPSAPKPAFK
jgi:hypothetical protein